MLHLPDANTEMPEGNLSCASMQLLENKFFGGEKTQHFQFFAAQDYNTVSPSPAALNSELTPPHLHGVCWRFADPTTLAVMKNNAKGEGM